MNKTITVCALAAALSLPAMAGILPVEQQAAARRGAKLQTKVTDARKLTFFEGFEGRPEGFGNFYDEWLPEGWQDLSKSGQTVPEVGENRHNLTWRVLDNDSRNNAPMCTNYAFEGNCFAYIMSDQAYGNHTDLAVQDEWLITPEVTPVGDDWLFFRLFFNAAWTVYNRQANDFTGVNNSLQIYASTDDGISWTKIWDVIDDEIRPNWTDDRLREELINWDKKDFIPVYVNVHDYLDKKVKFAFRFYGSTGHGVALDNISVGVPMPVAAYSLPDGLFRQGISPFCDYPAKPTLIMPARHEATWINRSDASQRYEWTYTGADGSTATSSSVNLVTPAYPFGTVTEVPSLVGIFESRRSEPYRPNHTMLQAGGLLHGEDAMGNECDFSAGYYDIMDPESKVLFSRDVVSFNPLLDDVWERNLGMLYGALDVMGFCNLYPASPVPYGFDFIDMAAIIPDPLLDDSEMLMRVYTIKNGLPDLLIGETLLKAADIPQGSQQMVNLHFTFDVPVVVPADTDIITLLIHSDREHDNIIFPYLKTTSSAWGNSLLFMFEWDSVDEYWYETFYDLNYMLFPTEGHFAGLLQGLGVTYATLEMLSADTAIDAPMEGITKEFKVKTEGVGADHISVTENGIALPDWLSFKVTPGADGVHTVAITVKPITFCENRETELLIVAPGASAKISVKQAGNPDMPSGLDDAEVAPAASVTVESGNIVVDGATGRAEVFDAAGRTVASARLSGRTVIAASHLPAGVYVVRVNGSRSFKIVK